jgi:hypothetical protein
VYAASLINGIQSTNSNIIGSCWIRHSIHLAKFKAINSQASGEGNFTRRVLSVNQSSTVYLDSLTQ